MIFTLATPMQYCNIVNCVLTCTSVFYSRIDQIVGKTLHPENSGVRQIFEKTYRSGVIS